MNKFSQSETLAARAGSRNKLFGTIHGEEIPGPVPERNEHHNVPEGLRHGGEMRRSNGKAALALGIQKPYVPLRVALPAQEQGHAAIRRVRATDIHHRRNAFRAH